MGFFIPIKGKSKGKVTPTKAEVTPVRRPIKKGRKNRIRRGEIPRWLKILGSINKMPDTSSILLNIITEIIKETILQERLFLIIKRTFFIFIFVVTRVDATIINKDKIRFNLNTNTRIIIAKIGQA